MEKTAADKAAEQSAYADELLKLTTKIVETTTTTKIIETTTTTNQRIDLDEKIENLKSAIRRDEKRIETKKSNLQAYRSDKRDTRHLQEERAANERTIARLQARNEQIDAILTAPDDDYSAIESCQNEILAIVAKIEARNVELKRYLVLKNMQALNLEQKRLERGAIRK